MPDQVQDASTLFYLLLHLDGVSCCKDEVVSIAQGIEHELHRGWHAPTAVAAAAHL